ASERTRASPSRIATIGSRFPRSSEYGVLGGMRRSYRAAEPRTENQNREREPRTPNPEPRTRTSLVSDSDHRIHATGTARRYVARGDGDDGDQERGAAGRRRTGRLHAEKNRRRQSPNADRTRETRDGADDRQPHAAADHFAQHPIARRAEREPNPDFARA